jgi:hypothetical protein
LTKLQFATEDFRNPGAKKQPVLFWKNPSGLIWIKQRAELDPENETVGEGVALPLESADGAGAGT